MGDHNNRHIPTRISGFGTDDNKYRTNNKKNKKNNKKVVQVSCSYYHTAFITDDGSIYTFGCGEYGQLGLNDNINILVPTEITELLLMTNRSKPNDERCFGQIYTFGISGHPNTDSKMSNVVVNWII